MKMLLHELEAQGSAMSVSSPGARGTWDPWREISNGFTVGHTRTAKPSGICQLRGMLVHEEV